MTQSWARALFERPDGKGGREFSGASWWSYYKPEWSSIGLWDLNLSVEDIEPLELKHPSVVEAADELNKLIS